MCQTPDSAFVEGLGCLISQVMPPDQDTAVQADENISAARDTDKLAASLTSERGFELAPQLAKKAVTQQGDVLPVISAGMLQQQYRQLQAMQRQQQQQPAIGSKLLLAPGHLPGHSLAGGPPSSKATTHALQLEANVTATAQHVSVHQTGSSVPSTQATARPSQPNTAECARSHRPAGSTPDGCATFCASQPGLPSTGTIGHAQYHQTGGSASDRHATTGRSQQHRPAGSPRRSMPEMQRVLHAQSAASVATAGLTQQRLSHRPSTLLSSPPVSLPSTLPSKLPHRLPSNLSSGQPSQHTVSHTPLDPRLVMAGQQRRTSNIIAPLASALYAPSMHASHHAGFQPPLDPKYAIHVLHQRLSAQMAQQAPAPRVPSSSAACLEPTISHLSGSAGASPGLNGQLLQRGRDSKHGLPSQPEARVSSPSLSIQAISTGAHQIASKSAHQMAATGRHVRGGLLAQAEMQQSVVGAQENLKAAGILLKHLEHLEKQKFPKRDRAAMEAQLLAQSQLDVDTLRAVYRQWLALRACRQLSNASAKGGEQVARFDSSAKGLRGTEQHASHAAANAAEAGQHVSTAAHQHVSAAADQHAQHHVPLHAGTRKQGRLPQFGRSEQAQNPPGFIQDSVALTADAAVTVQLLPASKAAGRASVSDARGRGKLLCAQASLSLHQSGTCRRGRLHRLSGGM